MVYSEAILLGRKEDAIADGVAVRGEVLAFGRPGSGMQLFGLNRGKRE